MDARTEQAYQQRIAELTHQLAQRDTAILELRVQLTQRDATIAALQQQVAELSKQVADLLAQVARLSKNSSNSSHRPAILSNHRYRLFLRAKNVPSAGRKAIHVMNASLLLRIRLTG